MARTAKCLLALVALVTLLGTATTFVLGKLSLAVETLFAVVAALNRFVQPANT